jgi:hypothetical protein
MKKRLIAILFFALISISFISAVEFDMKDEYLQGEMIIAKLSGDFIQPPLRENIIFYRGHVKIPINVDIAKFGDDYYFSAALIGKTENNYSVVIENVEYRQAGKTLKEDLVKNFTIINETVPFTLDKGILTTKDNFYVELENLKEDDLKVNFKITTLSGIEGGIALYEEDENHEIIINPGKERIDFNLNLEEGQTIKLIKFTADDLTYLMPVSLFAYDLSEVNKLYSFEIQPKEVNLKIPVTGDQVKWPIYIYNGGTGSLTDIKVSLSDTLFPYVTLSEDSFGRIRPESNANFNIIITPASEKTITGKLFVETGQSLFNEINIIINFEKGATPPAIPLSTDENCADKGAEVCSGNEICKDPDTTFYANDGNCCAAGCQSQTSSSIGKIIGWLLVLGVIGAVVWFFLFKYKKVKKPTDLLKLSRIKR